MMDLNDQDFLYKLSFQFNFIIKLRHVSRDN
jgi:hypothetical protein